MGQLLLVNPKRRKARKGRRSLSAKQVAAGFGGGGKRRKRARRSRASLHVNPKRRRGSKRRRLHRNPRRASAGGRGMIGQAKSLLTGNLMPAAFGAAGALAVDIAWAAAPIPVGIKGGAMAPLVKIAGAVALGALVSKFANKRFGQAMVAGYLTVTAYDMAKKLVAKMVPTLPLSEYPYDLGYMQTGQFIPDQSMGAYLGAPEGYGAVDDHAAPDGMGSYLNGYGDDVS
jgi:hypothetical protein